MIDIPDRPLDPPDDGEIEIICPLCDSECETIYESSEGEILGCENCVSRKDSFDWYCEERERLKEMIEGEKEDIAWNKYKEAKYA
jgi:formylmethanofuran dehydrogenase subunit B